MLTSYLLDKIVSYYLCSWSDGSSLEMDTSLVLTSMQVLPATLSNRICMQWRKLACFSWKLPTRKYKKGTR